MTDEDYLRAWRGLYVRQGKSIVDAPEADVAVAKSYPDFDEKGEILAGRRATIMAAKLRFGINEEIHVIHVVEFVESGDPVFIMGPKPVYDEYINEVLVTPASPPGEALAPNSYSGKILASPAVDYNYEITSYRMKETGTYSLQWRPGALKSNILVLTVEEIGLEEPAP